MRARERERERESKGVEEQYSTEREGGTSVLRDIMYVSKGTLVSEGTQFTYAA